MATIHMQQSKVAPTQKCVTGLAPQAIAMEAPPAEPIYGTVIPNRIFVGGISRDTTETDLLMTFRAYGTVRSTKIIVDHEGFNKGYGFVTFETDEEAQRLQSYGKCVILRNRRLNIAPAFKKAPTRPKLQPVVDTSGTVYFTTAQPAAPAVNNMPVEQYMAPNYIQNAPATDYSNTGVPTIYQQAPNTMQYQPIYQYYSVPVNMNVPSTVWHQNYYQEPQVSTSQASIPQQVAWEFDGANNNTWRSS